MIDILIFYWIFSTFAIGSYLYEDSGYGFPPYIILISVFAGWILLPIKIGKIIYKIEYEFF